MVYVVFYSQTLWNECQRHFLCVDHYFKLRQHLSLYYDNFAHIREMISCLRFHHSRHRHGYDNDHWHHCRFVT